MDNIVKFPDQNAPEADMVFVDHEGVEWFKYSIDYIRKTPTKDKSTWTIYFWALSFDDAEETAKQIRESVSEPQQVMAEVDHD